MPVLLVLAGVLVAGVILVLALSQSRGDEMCSTPDECKTQAMQLLDEEDYPGAVERLTWALDLVPEYEQLDYAHLWCDRGELNSDLEQYEEALSDFEQCAEWTGGSVEFEWLRIVALVQGHNARATLLTSSGDLEGAVEQLDQALALVPEDARTDYAYLVCDRGELNSWMGQIEEAISDFERCAVWTEGDAELEWLHDRARLLLNSTQAVHLLDDGDLEAALEHFDGALDLVPDDEHPGYSHLWCQRGEAHASLGRFEEATSDFERCIEWTEGDPDLEGTRAWAEDSLVGLRESQSQ